jgi:hypothetical protein
VTPNPNHSEFCVNFAWKRVRVCDQYPWSRTIHHSEFCRNLCITIRVSEGSCACSDTSICMCLLTFLTGMYEIVNRVRMQHVYSIRSSKSDVRQSCFFLFTSKQKRKLEGGGGYTYKRTRTSFHLCRSLLTREGRPLPKEELELDWWFREREKTYE